MIAAKLKEKLGIHPSSLVSLLASDPQQKAEVNTVTTRSIWWGDVERWEAITRIATYAKKGSMKCWSYDKVGQQWGETTVINADLAALISVDEIENSVFDLRDVEGFTASRQQYDFLRSLPALIRTIRPELLAELESLSVEDILADAEKGIRIHDGLHSFFHAEWDGRIFMDNIDGSHRLAVAIEKAKRENVVVRLTGRLRTFYINPAALLGLCRDFEMFVVSAEEKKNADLHKALAAFGTSYCEFPLPSPHTGARVLLLPKTDKRASKVSGFFRTAGFQNFGIFLDRFRLAANVG